MADSYNAGSARLLVEPQLVPGFHGRLRTLVDAREVDANVTAVPQLGDFQTRLNTLLATVDSDHDVTIHPHLAANFRNQIQQDLQTGLAGLGNDIPISVSLDLSAARAQLLAFRTMAERPININVDIDTTGALAGIATLAAAVTALGALIAGLPPIPNPPGGGGGGPGMGATLAMKGLGIATSAAGLAFKALAAVSLIPLMGHRLARSARRGAGVAASDHLRGRCYVRDPQARCVRGRRRVQSVVGTG